MIKILDSSTDDVFAALKGRAIHRDAETERIVVSIIDDVRQRGDAALLDSARRFDAPELRSVIVTEEEIDQATLDTNTQSALETSFNRVKSFYEAQYAMLSTGFDTAKGFGPGGVAISWNTDWNPDALELGERFLGQRMIAVRAAGVYVPGGNATYPSSVIMNAGPARVAGVDEVFVTTPAGRNGTLHPAVLVALRLVGVTKAFKIGGAAAIAALALGTESVPRVDKIVGPGNRFVNEAKRQLWGQVGLDGYAGPSEVCVLADNEANEEFAAADLLTQVEHAPDNAGFLVCLSRQKLDAILAAAERQLRGAPREATMRQALRDNSLAIVARDLPEAIDFVNAIAPEHLTLAVEEPEKAMADVRNAGCILLGEYTPESAGDYCLGPSHTLPTSGAARWQSPVNVLDFLKVQSVARLTPEDLQTLIPTIETLAEIEGFPAHGYGATVRKAPKDLKT
jgi:histidinol dehydrogenase